MRMLPRGSCPLPRHMKGNPESFRHGPGIVALGYGGFAVATTRLFTQRWRRCHASASRATNSRPRPGNQPNQIFLSSATPNGALPSHVPRVKSGNCAGRLAPAIDRSLSSETALHAAPSYTSWSVGVPARRHATS